MNIENIINKLVEKQNYHANHATFDFLPLLVKKDNDLNNYIPSINYHLLHNNNIEPYDYCWFIEKLHFQDFIFKDSKRQIIMRSDIKLLQLFASWSNSL